jgi:ankyrin repeat protein
MTILLAMALPTEKAKAVVKLLLDLGATSAQADMNHASVFHFVVAQDNHEILDLLLTNDRPVAYSVLNWMTTPSWGNQGDTPLTTAISMRHESMVSKLLSIGAKPEILYDSWIKTYLDKNTWAKTQSKHSWNLLFQRLIFNYYMLTFPRS